jgi:hypothetical protein
MMTPTIKIMRAGEPGTLGAVCNLYFDRPNHEGCPFQQVCCADNLPVTESPVRIINSVDAETLEMMAQAIRSTKEVSHEAVI